MTPKHVRLSVLLLALSCALPAAAERGYSAEKLKRQLDPRVRVILDQFEDAQAHTETMTAHFTQTREDSLFAESKVLKGEFWFTHPTNVRWEYVDADAGPVIVLATKELVERWIPSLNVVQPTDISKKSRRVFHYFGIGADIDNLNQRFDIRIGDASAHPGTEKLELRGRERRVKKRLDVIEMWIDKERGLPVAIRMVQTDGTETRWEFQDMEVNPEIPAETYVLDLPDDVEVRGGGKDLESTSELLEDLLDEDHDESPPENAGTTGTAGSQG